MCQPHCPLHCAALFTLLWQCCAASSYTLITFPVSLGSVRRLHVMLVVCFWGLLSATLVLWVYWVQDSLTLHNHSCHILTMSTCSCSAVLHPMVVSVFCWCFMYGTCLDVRNVLACGGPVIRARSVSFCLCSLVEWIWSSQCVGCGGGACGLDYNSCIEETCHRMHCASRPCHAGSIV